MRIGILNVIAVREMQVFTYAFTSYDLAIAQAIELHKGIDAKYRSERFPERIGENGLRTTIFKIHGAFELLAAQEIDVAEAVLPVTT